MNFSFCITTDYTNLKQLNEVIESIHDLKIPWYEINIIGGRDSNETVPKRIGAEESVPSSFWFRFKISNIIEIPRKEYSFRYPSC